MTYSMLFPPPDFDACAEDHDPDPNPETENARNPKANEEAVILAHEKPERDAGQKADEGSIRNG